MKINKKPNAMFTKVVLAIYNKSRVLMKSYSDLKIQPRQ